MLFFGVGDVVRDQSRHVDANPPEQAGAGPVEGFADLAVGVGLAVQAHDVQARPPQVHAGRQARDAGADDRDIAAKSDAHASRSCGRAV